MDLSPLRPGLSPQPRSLGSPSFTLVPLLPAAPARSLPRLWERRAERIPFPAAGSVPAAVPGSAEPRLSRACSDVQKFLPPSRGWMRRLCDRSGLLSHAEPLRLPLGTGLLLPFDNPPC